MEGLTELEIQAIVATASAAWSAFFDFAFTPVILMVWGPPFILLLAINLMRVALGKSYAPGIEALESSGERIVQDAIKRRKK